MFCEVGYANKPNELNLEAEAINRTIEIEFCTIQYKDAVRYRPAKKIKV